jgi:hypothetical protein
MKKIIMVLSIAFLLPNCQDDDVIVTNEPVIIEFQEVKKLMHTVPVLSPVSGIGNEYIMNSAAEFNILTAFYTPSIFADVEIDFTQSTVIAVIDDYRTGPYYDINIASITQTDNTVLVSVDKTSEPSELVGVVNQPAHIVRIPKTTLPVVFEYQ